MEKVIKSYKGFNKDMTCRGFQYEEGKEYEEETADACHSGSMLVNILWIALVIILRTNLFTMKWSRTVNLTEVKMIPRLHPQK